ncbi:Hypothetical protein A7982_01496 [Minicystis rosea]|nr:Hypothetical protein A7982_01496 [Minicystis rosea]
MDYVIFDPVPRRRRQSWMTRCLLRHERASLEMRFQPSSTSRLAARVPA